MEAEVTKIEAEIENVKKLLGTDLDNEAQNEIVELSKQKAELLKAMEAGTADETESVSKNDFRAVIVECRPGVGGDEAKIWAEELLRMYSRFAEYSKWSTELLDGGVIKIKGKDAYNLLRWETGVHRVQRVPVTEAAGRIHTSTASVVVLPEVAENLVIVRDDDLIWEFTRGGGHGGQNVNKVATAVRLTHKPSGLVVNCRQERSQEQNRKVALSMLRSQLWEIEEEKKSSALSTQRAKIGRSMRAEKIRTYNFPQNRVTDHRIGESWHKLERIIEGDLGDVVAACCAKLGEDYTGDNNQAADGKGQSDALSQPEVG